MTSGPNGEPLVVGIIYQDSRPANARLTTAVRKAVLLGHDSDSMPLLPVDRAGKSGRFISSVCPRGECFRSSIFVLFVKMDDQKLVRTRERSSRYTLADILLS